LTTRKMSTIMLQQCINFTILGVPQKNRGY
jgi:hypothetical protein